MNATEEPENCHLSVAGEPHIALAKTLGRLGISRKTAYRWRDIGKLTFVKHEGRIYCPTAQVIRLEVAQEARDAG